MDLPRDTETIDDLSALAWVHEELRRSLEAANKSLRRHLKEAEALAGSDVDAVDPSVLRHARSQIHQGVGALELVGLPAAASLLRAAEAALAKLVAQPRRVNLAAVETLERGSFALLDYVSRLLAGKPPSPLALFPQYRALQELAGAERIHPADLWPHDWRWHTLAADSGVAPRAADAATHGVVEAHLLDLMRRPQGPAAAAMSDLFAGLAAGASDTRLRTLWHLAAGFFDGQARGLLVADVYSKRVASRLLAQLRSVQRGDAEVSDRLAHDLLFFCAQAASPGDGRAAPRLAAVRQAFGLVHGRPVDYETARLGRWDPAWIAQARKRVAAAKESWSAVAGGELLRLQGLGEQFSLVGDSLKRLYPNGERLAQTLQDAVDHTVQAQAAPAPALAMEIATAILYLDASLEDAEIDHPQQAERIERLAQRIAGAARGNPSPALDGWMEELYRRVSDRQTMGSVVHELRASLSEVEKQIDEYFRRPDERAVLIPVPAQLQAMRGVLSVLGMDTASQAVLRMMGDVDALAQTEVDPERAAGTFDRLAGNLGALGFLIDMLGVQPHMAKTLFDFDADAGLLRSAVGTAARRASPEAGPAAPRLIEQAQSLAMAATQADVPLSQVTLNLERLSNEALLADQASLAEATTLAHAALARATDDDEREALRDELARTLTDFVHTASQPMPLQPEIEPIRLAPMPEPAPEPVAAAVAQATPAAPTAPAAPAAPVAPAAATPPGSTGLEDDLEMREIFLEEAREVTQGADVAVAALGDVPDDLGELTTVRRAFHTLKGSSRMVGLKAFGDAAWACEQLYNARLAEKPHADADLLGFTQEALAYLGGWIDAIADGRDGGHDPQVVSAAADALRLNGQRVPLRAQKADDAPTQVVPAVEAVEAIEVPEVPEVVEGVALAEAPVLDDPITAFDGTQSDAWAGGTAPSDTSQGDATLAGRVPELPSAQAPDLGSTAQAAAALADFNLDFGAAPVPAAPAVDFELDLGALDDVAFDESLPEVPAGDAPMPVVDAALELDAFPLDPTVEPPQEAAPAPVRDEAPRVLAAQPPPAERLLDAVPDPEQYRQIGDLAVPIPLFNIYLNEADEQSRRLGTDLAEWSLELHRPVGDHAIALAHSLAGNSATVGFVELSQLARSLEHALMRSHALGRGDATEARLFADVGEEIRRLLHQFAAGFLKTVPTALVQRLAEHERDAALRAQAPVDELEAPQDAVVDVDAGVEVVAPGEPVAAAPSFETAPATQPTPLEPLARLGDLGSAELKALPELPQGAEPVRADALEGEDDIDAVDAVDAELFPIFEEEAQDLLPQLASQLRDWARHASDASGATACMRTLHTLKGGARLAGAMRLGEMAHRLETAIEHQLARGEPTANDFEGLQQRVDTLSSTFEALRARDQQAYEAAAAAVDETPVPLSLPTVEVLTAEPADTPVAEAADEVAGEVAIEGVIEGAIEGVTDVGMDIAAPDVAPEAVPAGVAAGSAPLPTALPSIDWSRFAAPAAGAAPRAAAERPGAGAQAAVRVRAPLLDRLVNHAGEVSITRSRIESDVGQLKGSLSDLTDNLERLRRQLRDIELQAETQIASRMEAAKAASQDFDPLEFDRFTRFQELTRMMAESVNDVATVQRSLQRTVQSAEDELAAQARLTRDLQDDLLRTRMVEFEGLSDRLYRVVRLAAKETGKQVRLDIVGGSIEVDRGVLDRMTGAFEHLLRNCVSHGIESPADRTAQGKDPSGRIVVAVAHEGNEVAVEFRDDGAGLDLRRIGERARALGLLAEGAAPSDAELAHLIFTPGFSTAERVTELAGRGIGMDVVRAEVNAMGGRIETATAAGQGTSFRLVLPLTTAVTQVVMLRCGSTTVAVPSTLVEIVRRAKPDEIEQCYAMRSYSLGERTMPFFWLGALLQSSPRGTEGGRTQPVLVIRSAAQRVALHVDEVLGNQEVVVKNLGSQLSRLPGLAGMTLLASGAPALIYNPVALATLYGEAAWAATGEALMRPQAAQPAARVEPAVAQAPLVLVVDDSLTVRRVTQRLLVREGYRVTLAKDGLEGLEKLAEERPAVLLSDIEMPRMDGFDLVRNLRSDARLADLPVIMITSRIAQKHRDYAAELGVDHYLGKPYSEEDLLALVARYAAAAVPA